MAFSNLWTFLRELHLNRESVGAIAPSSPLLGKSLCKYISLEKGPKTIMEIGPGTGTVTQQIVECLSPGDRLHLVELNPKFCDFLFKLSRTKWAKMLEGVDFNVYCCPMEDFPEDQKYQFLVSSLPLNNFDYDLVRSILLSYQHFLTPGGKLSYFEYLAARKMREVLSKVKGDKDGLRTCHLLEEFIKNFQLEYDEVIMNFPPAVARHFSFKPNLNQKLR